MDDEINTMKLTELKARVARADYDVDVDAVAKAFLAHMLAARATVRRADARALIDDASDEIRLPA